MDDLPEPLLADVLLRLPLVTLYRFKVVCTKWLSLISAPYFLRQYASRTSISPRWAFLSRAEYDNYSKRYRAQAHQLLIDLHSGDLKCCPNPISMRSYRILGVSNGLVLYEWLSWGSGAHETNWGVCDPVTKRCVVLPPCISEHFWSDGCGFLTQMKEGVVASYTVVKFAGIPRRFEVFLSGTGKWKAYAPSHEYIMSGSLFSAPTDLHGILHWMHSFQGIFAYDPLRNPGAIRNIALPADDGGRVSKEDRIGMCGTHDGHLRYLESCAGLSLSVWVLNDYGCGDSWLLQHRARYADILQDVHPETLTKKIKPVSFHPLDPDVVYLGCDRVFVSYNMRDGKCHVLKTFDGDMVYNNNWDRAFCLVVPTIPPSLPSPSPPNLALRL
ncbi:putative F-box protein At3g28280 [Henckelia pumila]|uniref:putative F-box protein At3g28280 n=1 Tax=Henckelia pumila TaxID=405737 RepID=UPI003C6DD57F